MGMTYDELTVSLRSQSQPRLKAMLTAFESDFWSSTQSQQAGAIRHVSETSARVGGGSGTRRR